MKTLLVMRHAKSDWNADYAGDHERPLNGRGVRSARLMGEVLSEYGHAPDLVITSTAVRARSTASLANEAGTWGADVVLEAGLYGAGVDDAIQIASDAPDVDRVMLVGHQPTWSALVAALSGDTVDMKTADVSVIEFDIDVWTKLPTTRGKLVATYQPRD
jgi:phosphohistidine phosphatase